MHLLTSTARFACIANMIQVSVEGSIPSSPPTHTHTLLPMVTWWAPKLQDICPSPILVSCRRKCHPLSSVPAAAGHLFSTSSPHCWLAAGDLWFPHKEVGWSTWAGGRGHKRPCEEFWATKWLCDPRQFSYSLWVFDSLSTIWWGWKILQTCVLRTSHNACGRDSIKCKIL